MNQRPTPTHTLDSLRLASDQQQIQLVFWILLALPLVFGVAELMLLSQPPRLLVAGVLARAMLLGLMVALLNRLRRIRDRAAYSRAVSWTLAGAVLLILAQHMFRPRTRLVPFVVEVLVVTAFYAFVPIARYRQVAIAGSLTLGSLALLFFWQQDVTTPERVAITTTLLAANALGIASLWHRQHRERREERIVAREQESREALERTLAELRVLRGILPICSHCRLIRAQDGDWQQLDHYVRMHTEAEFSHGICPSCMDEHYDEHYDEHLTPA